jgi:phosphoglycolate phosphatase-like HAD superfamily hydrolase
MHKTHDLKAVFFDLDGTLLDVDMAAFLPVYLKLAARRIAHLVPPDQFVGHLLRATDVMAANDGSASNEATFWAAFTEMVGKPRDVLEPVFARFYAEDFPTLQTLARPCPGAREVLAEAFALGYDVAIATNPVFPATAVEQRLAWAGVADFPYSRVTTYENSRFCKPNLRYFDALAEELGHAPEACLMVGDEDTDMAAGRGGYPTFLTPSAMTNLGPATPAPLYQGNLAAVAEVLRAGAA